MANVPNGQEQQHAYTGQDYYTPAQHSHAHYSYPDPQNLPQYTAASYDPSAYNAEGMRNNIEAQLNAELGSQSHHQQQPAPPSQTHPHIQQQLTPQPTNFMAAFQQKQQHTPTGTSQHPVGYPAQSAVLAPQQQGQPLMQASSLPQSGPAAWRHFTDNIMTNLGAAEEHVGLQSVGGVAGSTGVVGSVIAPSSFGAMQMPADGTQAWPLILGARGNANGGAAAGD